MKSRGTAAATSLSNSDIWTPRPRLARVADVVIPPSPMLARSRPVLEGSCGHEVFRLVPDPRYPQSQMACSSIASAAPEHGGLLADPSPEFAAPASLRLDRFARTRVLGSGDGVRAVAQAS